MPYNAGDILLVNDYSGQGDLIGNLIRAGEKARYGDVPAARWTHSALIVNTDGDLVEALRNGVERTNISKYKRHETKIISPQAPPGTRALAALGALSQAGDSYGILDFVSLALSLLTGLRLSLHADRQPICSELVSRYTEKYITSYPYCAERMMPADLDVYYGAPNGKPLSLPKRWLLLAQAVWWWVRPWKHGIRP